MTKGALYRHYKSKRDIFDCIVERMEQGDSEQAAEYDMSEDDKESMPDQYRTWDFKDQTDRWGTVGEKRIAGLIGEN